jgi:gluconokinase
VTVQPSVVAADQAERPLVVALDIGSSSVRAALHDRLGRSLDGFAVQVPYAWKIGPDGSVRLPHAALLGLVGQALDQLVAAAGSLSREVVAGGVSCFFHSIVGLDDAGRPMTPVLSWADTTSRADAAALRARIDPEWVHAKTGVPIHASYWPARMLRLSGEQGGIRRWAGFPELVAETMTGRPVISRSMASGTGLLDRAIGGWSTELLGKLAIDPGDLPALVGDDEPIGELSGTAARRWPQLSEAAWFAAWGDGACGNVGLGAVSPGEAALMVGTSGALRSLVGDPAPPIPLGLFAFRLGAGSVVGGQLSEGGGVLAWTSRLLGRSRASLERAAARIAPDGHGLTVLPYAFGERSLGYHDDARAWLAGLNPGTQAAAIYRAMLESVAFGFAAVDERLSGVLGRPPAIIASGGALTPLFTRVLADALARTIAVAPAFEASRRGAALLALRGGGILASLDEIPGPRSRRVSCDFERASRYAAARKRQRALYEAVLR